jgi:hypothetical protein
MQGLVIVRGIPARREFVAATCLHEAIAVATPSLEPQSLGEDKTSSAILLHSVVSVCRNLFGSLHYRDLLQGCLSRGH